jgi:adenylate cyclase
MKIFKGKAFFFKSIFVHIFLVLIIAFVSINFWENPIFDTIVNNSSATVEGSKDINLVMIDNKSLESYRWPWARSLYAEIFEYFQNYTNAKVVVFDSIITTLDKERPASSDGIFFNAIKHYPNLICGAMATSSEYPDENFGSQYDKEFYQKFSTDITDKRTANNDRMSNYSSLTVYPQPYFESLRNIGFVNLSLNPIDGVLRSSNDLISYNDNFYPSIALKAYLMANNTNKLTLTNKYIIVDKTGLKIPIFKNKGDIKHNIKYYKYLQNTDYSHEAHSAIDIINSAKLLKEGKKPIIDPKTFDNKIVIIGANALGVEDALESSISLSHPGADIQATILDNFLRNDFLTKITPLQNALIIILLSILTFVIILNFAFLPSLLLLIAIAIVYFVICLICFNNNIIPLVITPLATQLSTMIFGYSYRFILEGKNKEKIKNAMGKYLSQDIMKNVVQNIDDIKLGGKKANVTVLFADIRGFTSMSEKMSAEEVSVILNEYFSEIEPIITKYNGVINKFIGDAVMAIFGEPIQDINHPQNAVKCACAMLKKVEELQQKWLFEGKPKIEIGIGINTGEAFVGNIGSEKRLEYTVIGDMVNLASRIESYNKVYKTNLLISSSTYSQVSDFVDVIKIADVQIRGKAKRMDIYEVLRLSD